MFKASWDVQDSFCNNTVWSCHGNAPFNKQTNHSINILSINTQSIIIENTSTISKTSKHMHMYKAIWMFFFAYSKWCQLPHRFYSISGLSRMKVVNTHLTWRRLSKDLPTLFVHLLISLIRSIRFTHPFMCSFSSMRRYAKIPRPFRFYTNCPCNCICYVLHLICYNK